MSYQFIISYKCYQILLATSSVNNNIQNIMLYDRECVFMLSDNNGEKIAYIFTIILFRDGTVVGTTSMLRLGQLRIPGSIPAHRGRVISFCESVQTGFGVRPVSSSLAPGALLTSSGRCVKLTTHPHLLPSLGISGAVPLLPHLIVWRE